MTEFEEGAPYRCQRCKMPLMEPECPDCDSWPPPDGPQCPACHAWLTIWIEDADPIEAKCMKCGHEWEITDKEDIGVH